MKGRWTGRQVANGECGNKTMACWFVGMLYHSSKRRVVVVWMEMGRQQLKRGG